MIASIPRLENQNLDQNGCQIKRIISLVNSVKQVIYSTYISQNFSFYPVCNVLATRSSTIR